MSGLVLTTRHVLPVAKAADLAAKRHHRIQQRKRRPRAKRLTEGQLVTDEAS